MKFFGAFLAIAAITTNAFEVNESDAEEFVAEIEEIYAGKQIIDIIQVVEL